MVRDAREMGTDQVREVKNAAKENGLTFFPSLKFQDTAQRYAERCGLLKWEHGSDVCFGGPEDNREAWAYDFTNELVRQDKLDMIREMLGDYEQAEEAYRRAVAGNPDEEVFAGALGRVRRALGPR